MKASELISHIQEEIRQNGDYEIIMSTSINDGEHSPALVELHICVENVCRYENWLSEDGENHMFDKQVKTTTHEPAFWVSIKPALGVNHESE